MQIKIDEATASQLAAFAAAKGLDGIHYRLGTFEIRKRLIEAGYTGDTINVEEGNGPVPAATPVKPDDPSEQFIEIYVEQQEGPGGSDPVYINHNFVSMRVPRGEWCKIKRKFLECFSHATREVIDPLPMNPNGMDMGGTLPSRFVPQYPFRMREIA